MNRVFFCTMKRALSTVFVCTMKRALCTHIHWKWINRIFLKMRENVVYFPDSFMSVTHERPLFIHSWTNRENTPHFPSFSKKYDLSIFPLIHSWKPLFIHEGFINNLKCACVCVAFKMKIQGSTWRKHDSCMCVTHTWLMYVCHDRAPKSALKYIYIYITQRTFKCVRKEPLTIYWNAHKRALQIYIYMYITQRTLQYVHKEPLNIYVASRSNWHTNNDSCMCVMIVHTKQPFNIHIYIHITKNP